MKTFVVGLVQMSVGPEREANLERAARLGRTAVERGAQLVVLPEMFNCPYDIRRFAERAERLHGGPTSAALSSLARELEVHLVGGTIPERDGARVYNTATVWAPSGELLATYRKTHLFDVNVPGGIVFHESEALTAGDALRVVPTALGQIGLAICYDLRFPELIRRVVLDGAGLVVIPGAFNTTTGPMHWEPLLRARAIENTSFVVACSPAPHPDVDYPSWGHSMIIDPFGTVLATAEREEAVITAEVDGGRLEKARAAIPVLRQRRPELY